MRGAAVLALAALAGLAALAALACGHAQENALLDQFFSASRLRDRTAAQSIATVFFDPADQGLVRRFSIRNVTPEERSGGVVSKNVTISASVESLDGAPVQEDEKDEKDRKDQKDRKAQEAQTTQKTIFVTMQRRADTAWMITGVTVAAADPRRPPR